MQSYFRLLILILLAAMSYTNAVRAQSPSVAHPEWSRNAVIYEVNLRQFTEEGTIAAFRSHLPRLKDLGADILWFMPINPIGEKNRKGSLGSYYSVRDYRALNPEFGTLEDFKALVKECHEMGFHVIIDWVANHCAWDNPIVTEHPEWMTRDSSGAMIPPVPDWSDVADLNYDSQELRAWMIDAMQFWVREADIDGFRCDVAGMVPLDFWKDAYAKLIESKHLFMLAEHEAAEYHSAFDASYGWHLFHTMVDVAQRRRPAGELGTYFIQNEADYPRDAFRMYFTSNHDENTWNGTEFERFGSLARAFAVLAMTSPGIPLLYTGQEVGLDRRLKFFDKDSVGWKESEWTLFYSKLFELKHTHPALLNGAEGGDLVVISHSEPERAFCFQRTKDSAKVMVIANLSSTPISLRLTDSRASGAWHDVLSDQSYSLGLDTSLPLEPGEALLLTR